MYFLWAGGPLTEQTQAQGCDACEMSSTSSQKSLKLYFNEINKLIKNLLHWHLTQQWTTFLKVKTEKQEVYGKLAKNLKQKEILCDIRLTHTYDSTVLFLDFPLGINKVFTYIYHQSGNRLENSSQNESFSNFLSRM